MKLFGNIPVIGTINVDTFTPNSPKITRDTERLLCAAYAAGMRVAYGYMGCQGHFCVTTVCLDPSPALDAALRGFEERKIICNEVGEWEYVL